MNLHVQACTLVHELCCCNANTFHSHSGSIYILAQVGARVGKGVSAGPLPVAPAWAVAPSYFASFLAPVVDWSGRRAIFSTSWRCSSELAAGPPWGQVAQHRRQAESTGRESCRLRPLAPPQAKEEPRQRHPRSNGQRWKSALRREGGRSCRQTWTRWSGRWRAKLMPEYKSETATLWRNLAGAAGGLRAPHGAENGRSHCAGAGKDGRPRDTPPAT